MSFESPQEDKLAPEVDKVFNFPTGKSRATRIGIAAFKILDSVEAESTANMEVFTAWTQAGPNRSDPFIHIGPAMLAGYISTKEGMAKLTAQAETSSVIETTESIAKKEKRLEEARNQLRSKKIIVGKAHRLRTLGMNRAETLARQLKYPPTD